MPYLRYLNHLLDLILTKDLYHKPNNENFDNNIEKEQYRTCLAIFGGVTRHIKRKNL